MNAKQKITKARAALVLSHPFWASLALQVPLVEDFSCNTGWTDGTRIAYNPEYIESLSEGAVISFVAHEVAHPAFLHHLREGDRDHGKWNRAGDFAVNLILRDSGFEIPQDWLCDEKYRGMSSEEIYTLLPDTGRSKEKHFKTDGEAETGNPNTDSPAQDSPADEPDTEAGDGGDAGVQGSAQEGFRPQEQGYGHETDPASGGEKTASEEPEDCGPGEVRPYSGKHGHEPSASEKRREEIDWKIRITQAAEIAKAQGDLPGSLERLIKNLVTPKLNWRAILASFMSESLDQDYSWKEPNRRYASAGLYLPSLESREGGSVLVIVDTSGSVSEDDLKALAGEIQGISSSYDVVLDVLYVDSEVQGHQRYTTGESLKLKPKGGGGTDFKPAFEWAEHRGILPSCAVYLTDGWCDSFPEKTPNYPVLWVLGGDFTCKKFQPPFGETIRMD